MSVGDPGAAAVVAVAALLALGGACASFRGVRFLARALRCADDRFAPLWLVRGIRGVVVAVGAGALAGGMLFGQDWLLVFGAVFLAEELYETGVIALILRVGHRRDERDDAPSAPSQEVAARLRSASSVASSAAKKHSIRSSWSVMS